MEDGKKIEGRGLRVEGREDSARALRLGRISALPPFGQRPSSGAAMFAWQAVENQRATRLVTLLRPGTAAVRGQCSDAPLRLFIAISLPEAVKDEIEKCQNEMRAALPGNFIRWTKREQFHLTLKFLGNVAETRVAELIAALRAACLDFSALQLRAERIGFFPDLRFPRVIWVGVHDSKDVLALLQNAIEAAVKSFTNEAPEKKFTGHVTLGRIPRIRKSEAEALNAVALGMAERFFGEWVADKVELIRSELSSNGSHYTTLADIALKQ